MVLLAAERYPPSLVMGGAVTILLVGGVIDETAALKGFGNEAPITVAALYILAGATEVTGALDAITARVLGGGGSGRGRAALARLLFPLTAASAFMPNTPLVGMVAPRVVGWCRSIGTSPSLFLMPIAFATVLGGCITVIGTSTNLVISGLLTDAGMERLGLFEITAVGLPVAIAGAAMLIVLTPLLLRERRAPSDALPDRVREYTLELIVTMGGPLAGKDVTEAGLRSLEGVYLAAIERADRTHAPVAADEVLQGGDRLIFAGDVNRVMDLQRTRGLEPGGEAHLPDASERGDARRFYEAVLGPASPLVGTTLKEADFRRRHGAAVLAIHRSGEAIRGKLGEVRLRPGDVLLLIGPPALARRWRDRPDFLVLAPVTGTTPVRRRRAGLVQLIALGFIVIAATGVLSLLQASLIAAVALIGLRVISPGEARAAVDLDVILVMATSFGLGIAIGESGLAEQIARGIVTVFEPTGDIGVLAGILIATMIVTELLSNNAAAILMFPIALETAAQTGLAPRPFVIAVLFGASLSFLTPIGYQANTLVWNLGGYRYADFPRLGAPLTVMVAILLSVLVPIAFPLR